jgi:signal transduction histidine kinase
MHSDRNRLLQLFGDEARGQLGHAVTVELDARHVLHDPGMPVLYVYFPIDAVISLISTTENGASVEVGLIGREGMIGLAGVLGTVEGGTSAIVQVSGAAVRVPTASLKALRLANGSVRTTIDLYIEARFLQTAQAVACSRLHPLDARLARWLLGVHDRTARSEFVISQESLGELLGVHRPTVSMALQQIQDAGAIVRRGRAIVIADRSRLEGLACECHRVLDREFERLLSARRNRPEAPSATEAPSQSRPAESDPTAALEAMRDIAGRLLLVSIREQEAREQAEEANRAKDQFLAMVSHELRNPLNVILGWCTMLRAQDSVPSARGLEAIAQNAHAQLKLIEDLLDAARVTSATLTVHPRTISLLEVVQNTVDTLRPVADQRQVDLRLTIADDMPPIAADADRLRQVLLNVLTNSLKFTDAGGSVDVRLGSTNSHARLCIHDTGRGIAPEVVPHVFERFRQGSGTDTGRQGLGLGLTIARAIIELHGGTIAIESPGLNQGTTCTIDLPLEARRRERRAEASAVKV